MATVTTETKPAAQTPQSIAKPASKLYKPQGHNYRFRVDGKVLEVGDDGFYHPKTEAETAELKWQASKGLVYLAEVPKADAPKADAL